MKDTMSFYNSHIDKTYTKEIDLENYFNFVRFGTYQDGVLKGRAVKAKIKEPKDSFAIEYKKIKSQQPCVTGSCVMNPEDKKEANIRSMNGYIVIDIDHNLNPETIASLKADRYTRGLHISFGGDGICIFVPINMKKDFRDCFAGLAQYYLDNYNVTVDSACSNPNRLRYMSYDPDVYENTKAQTFTPKYVPKEIKPKELNFVFTRSDFDNILEQIKERGVDLCKEDYARYTRIGMALANKFGEAGREYFHFICSYGSKYNPKHADKDYTGFVKSTTGKCTIATLYYYCKEEGFNLYTERTKQIINRVKTSKAQGNPTFESVAANMMAVHQVLLSDEDKELVKVLIESKTDYSKGANEGVSEIEQLERFIVDTFEPQVDLITKNMTLRGEKDYMEDKDINDIYISCKKNFDFNVKYSDVLSILNSSAVKSHCAVKEFFKQSSKYNDVGLIEQYARCIQPESDYNVWAFTKWIVGAVHNWTAHKSDKLVSPLTLVLTGQRHGIGKTSFFRNIMPEELEAYVVEEKIDCRNKDHIALLPANLMVIDQEFGGAVKDVKDYKALSDMNIIKMRRPYGKTVEKMKRLAILGGTTNETNILRDVTGNRRILPINTEMIKYHEMLAIDKTALLMEAYNMLREGYDWIIRTQEDIDYIKANTEENEDVLPVEELFFKFFSLTEKGDYRHEMILNQGDILDYMTLHGGFKPTKYDLKDVFVKNNLTYKNNKLSDGTQKKGFRLFVGKNTLDYLYGSRNKPESK